MQVKLTVKTRSDTFHNGQQRFYSQKCFEGLTPRLCSSALEYSLIVGIKPNLKKMDWYVSLVPPAPR